MLGRDLYWYDSNYLVALMAEFDENELKKLAKLCRIECTADEEKALHSQIASILNYIQQLNEVNTDGVEPCYRVSETLKNVMREDVVGDLLPREEFLANAPAHVGGMIRVPPVIKSTNQP
jgi:aspartyl-tRNA(Asn)/glutamyl-tRNA(Gln) amidotransferase subunit C